MDYIEFINAVSDYINESESDVATYVHTTVKNNGVRLSGLSFRKSGYNASPTIYMENYYSDYLAGDDICDTMIRRVMSSPACLAVIPIQDWLCLDNESRMNYPGTVGGTNWRYRMMPGDLSDALLKRQQRINNEYGRN